ncbi:hypothetical protein [Ornithinibacillus sp. FSL M8-0202]|uniref:hypothetical protein n=1 Tax=Ornithinibacillus sp. FSL M8-0202 TaxID=2921616 RepID=UPI0030D4D20B
MVGLTTGKGLDTALSLIEQGIVGVLDIMKKTESLLDPALIYIDIWLKQTFD